MLKEVRWFLLLLMITGCSSSFHASRPRTDGCDPARICATARVVWADTIDVSLEIPSTTPIELHFVEAVLGRGFTNEAVRLVESDGTEVPWPGRFVPRQGRISLHYRVRPPDPPPHQRRLQTFTYADGMHIKGYTFLPELEGGPATLRFQKRRGDVILGSSPGTGQGFEVESFQNLVRATYEIGQAPHRCARISNLPICVVSSRTDEAGIDRILDHVAGIVTRAEKLLGPTQASAILISDHRHGTPTPLGATIGTGVTILSDAPLRVSIDPTAFLLTHELLHLWNPGKRRVPAVWLREGLTEYMAYLLTKDAAEAADADFAGWIQAAYRRYQTAYSDHSIEETSDELVYPAGVVAGFCLDQSLEADDSSTAEILRRLLAQVPPGDESTIISEDFFLAEVAKVSPRSAGYFKLLISDRRFNFSQCMVRMLSERPKPPPHEATGVSSVRHP